MPLRFLDKNFWHDFAEISGDKPTNVIFGFFKNVDFPPLTSKIEIGHQDDQIGLSIEEKSR